MIRCTKRKSVESLNLRAILVHIVLAPNVNCLVYIPFPVCLLIGWPSRLLLLPNSTNHCILDFLWNHSSTSSLRLILAVNRKIFTLSLGTPGGGGGLLNLLFEGNSSRLAVKCTELGANTWYGCYMQEWVYPRSVRPYPNSQRLDLRSPVLNYT